MLVALLISVASALPAQPSITAATKEVYNFGPDTWIENIAVRSNGDLLLTSLGKPGYLTLLSNPSAEPTAATITGFEFPDTLGIVEAEPDVFYVLSSNFTLETITAQAGSNSLWRVDFSHAANDVPTAIRAIDLPQSVFLNGLTAYNETILLAADSALGVVFAIDLVTQAVWIAANDTLMKPVAGQAYLEGINGLHLRPSHRHIDERTLCFTNSQLYIFACVTLDCEVRATGPAQLVAHPKAEQGFTAINWDDFAFNRRGVAFVATEKGNSVQSVSPDGKVELVAGTLNSTAIAEPTSTAFGRSHNESSTLYVATAGALAFPVVQNGQSIRTGAQVVAVDLSHVYLA